MLRTARSISLKVLPTSPAMRILMRSSKPAMSEYRSAYRSSLSKVDQNVSYCADSSNEDSFVSF